MALSDGLFAIVLTLLVLDLKPEQAGGGPLTYVSLVELWPRLFAFFLTFMVGGSYWVSHHADMDTIVRYDRPFLWLNLMFLLSVSLLPFTTMLIGQSTTTTTWTLYAINVVSMGLTLAAVWGYANVAGLNTARLNVADWRHLAVRHLVVPLVFGVSIPVAFVAPTMAPYTALLTPVAFRVVAARIPPSASTTRPPVRRRGLVWLVLGYAPILLFGLWSVWLGLTGNLSGGTGSH
jgi:uncharacterized membrane protein